MDVCLRVLKESKKVGVQPVFVVSEPNESERKGNMRIRNGC